METTVLVELIGWSIGYASFHNMVANSQGNRPIIGKVAKLDFNTHKRLRGQFARMAIFVNLDKPLISQILDLCLFSVGDKGNAGVNDGSMETGSAIGDSVEKDLDLAVDIEIDAGKRSVGRRATVSIGASLNYSGQNDGSRKVDFGVSSPIEKVHEDFVGKLANKGAVL
ncbi:hypothetical protein Godav_004136 [Gossypium davidsonii]|uniref:Uncharacterized protein n=1 Tax=Gossypium davidsonii TaxID=34287 RepID=A0A7J8SKY1_GOSDV|nr:hypothetical protein [Gossypium davidsonii]